jgi:MCM N-terminal domain
VPRPRRVSLPAAANSRGTPPRLESTLCTSITFNSPYKVVVHLPNVTMDTITLRDEEVKQRIRLAEEFLDPSDQAARSYRAEIILMLNQKRRRLQVSLDEIREHNRELADGLLSQPFDFSLAFNEALKNVIKALPNRPRAESADDVVG